METEERTRSVAAHEGPIWAVTVDADWRRALTAGADGLAHLWDLERGEIERTLRGHSWDVQGVAFLADGKHALTAGRDKSVKLWELASGRCTKTLARHAGSSLAIALWCDGAHVLSLTEDKTVELWSIDTEDVVARWPGEAAITAIAVAKGDRIAMGDATGRVTYLKLKRP